RRLGSIVRITNPRAASQTVEAVGRTSDGRGAAGMTFVNSDLYLAEGGAVTRIALATSCTGACIAATTAIQSAAPTGIVADAKNRGVIYVADTSPAGDSSILRFTLATSTQVVLATSGVNGASTVPFHLVFALSSNPNTGALFISDDPTGGAQP